MECIIRTEANLLSAASESWGMNLFFCITASLHFPLPVCSLAFKCTQRSFSISSSTDVNKSSLNVERYITPILKDDGIEGFYFLMGIECYYATKFLSRFGMLHCFQGFSWRENFKSAA